MKWGMKKSSSSSSSSSHLLLISHVFPISWFTKFNQTSNKAEPQLQKSKRKNKVKSSSLSSSLSVSFGGSQLYGGDFSFSPEILDGRMGRCNSRLSEIDGDGGFWRLSFGDENFEGKKTRNVLKSVLYNSDNELDFPLASNRSCGSTTTRKVGEKEETQKFSNMISDIRKMREVSPEIVTCKGVEDRDEIEFETPRRKIVKDGRVVDRKSRKGDQRVLKEEQAKQKCTHPVQEFEFELEPVTTIQTTKDDYHNSIASYTRKSNCISSSNSRKTNAALKEIDTVFVDESKVEHKTEKDSKIKELLSESEKPKKSLNVSRESQKRRKKKSCKVRAYSPRTASKIEMKMTKKSRKRAVEGLPALENFAVVKSSFNPQKDFRDSMVEMITERGIKQPKELEDLLACYLSLNSEEFHDLIIKVFRQVWFNLNQTCISPELEEVHCCYD